MKLPHQGWTRRRMEEEQHWSYRDFTQIKPRRPEGTCENEDWESGKPSFSFMWPGAATSLTGAASSGQEENFDDDGGSHDDDADDFIEPRINLGLEDIIHPEFEFTTMNSISPRQVAERGNPSGISPADELFFKGQLLPLHLPPRIQMVKKLSLEKPAAQHHEGQQVTPRLSTGDAETQRTTSRLFQPGRYSKFGINVNSSSSAASVAGSDVVLPPAATNCSNPTHNLRWWDPRDHRDSVSSSTTTTTDRDSSGDSSSSRDSNGSSQDCFDKDQFQQPSNHDSSNSNKAFLHNREVFSTHSALPDRSMISTWLRPPFKWKVLFGAKKPSSGGKPPINPSSMVMPAEDHHHHKSSVSSSNSSSSLLAPPYTLNSQQVAPEYSNFSASPMSDRYYSDCSGELSFSGELMISGRVWERAQAESTASRDKSSSGVSPNSDHSGGMAKAKEYLNRYMKVLKPLRRDQFGRSSEDTATAARLSSASNPGSATSSASLLPSSFDKRSPATSRAINSSRNFPAFSQSSRFSPKEIVSSPRKVATMGPATPRPKANVRPVVSASSSMSELHSAIQGAIAHCKESQSKHGSDVCR